MKQKRTYILPLFFLLVLTSSSYVLNDKSVKIELLTQRRLFYAGEPIQLQFKSDTNIQPILYCSNSYSTTLLNPIIENESIIYKIPQHIALKKGLLNWTLFNENKSLVSGVLDIKSNSKKTVMESYLGPRSILAGERDYSMLIVTPTDKYDNPVADSTQILVKHQFLSTIRIDTIFTNHLMAWKNIFSYKKSGRILVSSECNKVTSKEFAIEVFPNNPENFTISENRMHDFADGNQIVTFSTSIIKDMYDNVVSDGTHVEFFIKDSTNAILKTSGNTIKGIATAKMLHPDHEDKWKAKAYVTGMAESDEVLLDFQSVMADFEAVFSKDNRTITIGPLKSFMQQILPNGFIVKLHIYKNNEHIDTKIDTSKKGYVQFHLSPDFYEGANYTFKIESGGIQKLFSQKQLHD